MAIVQLDPNLIALHGRIGDVVYKTYGRKIVATRVPCFDGYIPSPAQRARRQRMAEATAYAKRIYADPIAKAVYVAAAKKLHRQPFRLAISDYLRVKGSVSRGSAAAESATLRSELETRRPRRVGLTPRTPRPPRRSPPSRPIRPIRPMPETVRASNIEPPRRGRRGSSSPPTTIGSAWGRDALVAFASRRPRDAISTTNIVFRLLPPLARFRLAPTTALRIIYWAKKE